MLVVGSHEIDSPTAFEFLVLVDGMQTNTRPVVACDEEVPNHKHLGNLEVFLVNGARGDVVK